MIKTTLTLSAAAMLMLSVSTTAQAQEALTSQPDASAAITEHSDAMCHEKALESDQAAHACVATDEQLAQIAPSEDVEERDQLTTPPAEEQAQAAMPGELDAHREHLAGPTPQADDPDLTGEQGELAQTGESGPDAMPSADVELQGGAPPPPADESIAPMTGEDAIKGSN